jgi:hypothetical protein
VTALAAAVQAAEAIGLLTGRGAALVDRLLAIDVATGRHRVVPLPAGPRCTLCTTVHPITRSEAR